MTHAGVCEACVSYILVSPMRFQPGSHTERGHFLAVFERSWSVTCFQAAPTAPTNTHSMNTRVVRTCEKGFLGGADSGRGVT